MTPRFDNIPAELRDLPQWVVWRAIERRLADGTTKVTKPPYRASDPSREASTTDRTTWGTFEEAKACYLANMPHVAGIGMMLTREGRVCGLDLDSEGRVRPEYRQSRLEGQHQMWERVVSYTERSPSGDGLHVIMRAQMPVSGKQWPNQAVELYGWDRFLTFTGDVVAGRDTVTDQQDFIDSLQLASLQTQAATDITLYRQTEMSDEEVVRVVSNGTPSFAPRYQGVSGCDKGEWSNSFYAVVAALDRVTGSVAQLERIVKNSPMVTNCGPSGSGETRPHKANRIFNQVLARVRSQNNSYLASVEHGAQIMAGLRAAQAERAAESARLAKELVGKLSSQSIALIERFTQIEPEYQALTRPPGMVGEFVTATEAACPLPFLKYAIPATLSVLSGVVGRGYKVDGDGLNLNFLLIAPSAAGKTQNIKVWRGFYAQAIESTEVNLAVPPPKVRIIEDGTASIQAIMEDFIATPSCTWVVDECASQLKNMNDSRSPTGIALRGSYNRLFDASNHDTTFSSPRSVAGRKANIVAIPNLNVSTFWATVPDMFELTDKDVFDGFLSRVVVVRHSGKSGVINETQNKTLPPHLLQPLQDRIRIADALDAAYALPNTSIAKSKLTDVVVPNDVRVLLKSLYRTAQEATDAANEGEIPKIYTGVSRLAPTALRIAGVLAVLENPNAPAITPQQLKWAFGYLLQNLVSLLSDMDNGEIGSKTNDDYERVTQSLLRLQTQSPHKEAGGVAKTALRNDLAQRAPFKNHRSGDTHKAINTTLDAMLREGLVLVDVRPTGGAPKHLYSLHPEYLRERRRGQ